MKPLYESQVRLVVKCLSAIAGERDFCLKGGSSINLFLLDLPRLSVDIDLTYGKTGSRRDSFEAINTGLEHIGKRLTDIGVKSRPISDLTGISKLICFDGESHIKIEPNYTLRGCMFEPAMRPVQPSVENRFGYATMKIASEPEVWGGKMCAALDRQHPRDLFDIRNLLRLGGLTPEVFRGFLFMAMCHNRNFYELFDPIEKNVHEVYEREFSGMTDMSFTLKDHYETLHSLVKKIRAMLTDEEREYICDFVLLKEPSGRLFPQDPQSFPGIQWKLLNLKKFKEMRPAEFAELCNRTFAVLDNPTHCL